MKMSCLAYTRFTWDARQTFECDVVQKAMDCIQPLIEEAETTEATKECKTEAPKVLDAKESKGVLSKDEEDKEEDANTPESPLTAAKEMEDAEDVADD